MLYSYEYTDRKDAEFARDYAILMGFVPVLHEDAETYYVDMSFQDTLDKDVFEGSLALAAKEVEPKSELEWEEDHVSNKFFNLKMVGISILFALASFGTFVNTHDNGWIAFSLSATILGFYFLHKYKVTRKIIAENEA